MLLKQCKFGLGRCQQQIEHFLAMLLDFFWTPSLVIIQFLNHGVQLQAVNAFLGNGGPKVIGLGFG